MPGRRHTQRAKKGERRAQLLEHARQLIATKGYGAVAPQQITEAAGTTPAVFARNFADMPDVAAGIVTEMHKRLIANASDREGPSESLHDLNALVERFQAEMKLPASPVHVVHLLLAEPAPDLRADLQTAFEPIAAGLAEQIRAGQQEGVFRRTLDPQHAAWELLRALFGQALFRDIEPAADRDNPQLTLDCLLHGLLKTDV